MHAMCCLRQSRTEPSARIGNFLVCLPTSIGCRACATPPAADRLRHVATFHAAPAGAAYLLHGLTGEAPLAHLHAALELSSSPLGHCHCWGQPSGGMQSCEWRSVARGRIMRGVWSLLKDQAFTGFSLRAQAPQSAAAAFQKLHPAPPTVLHVRPLAVMPQCPAGARRRHHPQHVPLNPLNPKPLNRSLFAAGMRRAACATGPDKHVRRGVGTRVSASVPFMAHAGLTARLCQAVWPLRASSTNLEAGWAASMRSALFLLHASRSCKVAALQGRCRSLGGTPVPAAISC